MWEIHSSHQLLTFLFAIVLGLLFCLLYDIFRALRVAVHFSNIAIAVQDILFWAVCAFLNFLFFLARTSGEIRLFVIIGIVIGFLVCRVSVSRIIFPALCFVFKKTRSFLRLINRGYAALLSRFLHLSRTLGSFFAKRYQNIKNLIKKT